MEVREADWRFDIENAPRGRMVEVAGPKGSVREMHQPEQVIVAASDGKTVTVSRWLPNEQRWNMLGKAEKPVAWMAFPAHPALTTPSVGTEPTSGEVNPEIHEVTQ